MKNFLGRGHSHLPRPHPLDASENWYPSLFGTKLRPCLLRQHFSLKFTVEGLAYHSMTIFVHIMFWEVDLMTTKLTLTWQCGEGTNGVQRRFSGFTCTKFFCLVRHHDKWSSNSLRLSIITHLHQYNTTLSLSTAINNTEKVCHWTIHNWMATTPLYTQLQCVDNIMWQYADSVLVHRSPHISPVFIKISWNLVQIMPMMLICQQI